MGGDDRNGAYEIECPACKTTKYRNPQMKLMVNVCGHALCDNCVQTLFVKETAQCPECEIVLKRAKFRVQLFEDPLVEKEIGIRRKVARIYNKVEEDFATDREYDDYLEEIEHIVYSLTYDADSSEAQRKLDLYEKQHKDEIKKNYLRKSAADLELERIIEEEKLQALRRQEEQKKELEKHKLLHSKHQASLLQDLMANTGDATMIVRSHVERLKQEKEGQEQDELRNKIQNAVKNPKEFSSGVRIGVTSNTNNVPELQIEAEEYVYTSPTLPQRLSLPEYNELASAGYLQHIRQAGVTAYAGGYTEELACMRALHEFMSGHILAKSV